jgi:hypothetical protein
VFERLDDGAGVEPQHLREPGTRDPPLLAGGDRLLLEIGDHVADPIDLERGVRSRLRPAIFSYTRCPCSSMYSMAA